ncbi:MAG: M20 family metallo-hydrolase [Alphaproteobacteria bacterium]|nr:M20 family metallo-hydrolase [Alphaproteobacteria bacterium]
MTASAAVREARLWQRHAEMARLGATAKGGVNRQALSAEDVAARKLLASWAQARGFAVSTDAIGNLFVRRAGEQHDAAPVMTGSHMDSQPTGGRFDGIYGVLAGFEVLEALEDAGIRTRRPLEVVAWMNEEGSRFPVGAMGSAVFAGRLALDKALAVRDPKGTTVAAALAETMAAAPVARRARIGGPVAAYVEAHIEQGPRLEADCRTIGVVTGIQGSRRYAVEVTGEEAHAGTTPRAARKDALSAAVAVVAALETLMEDPTDTVRFTVGRFEVFPGSPNTVPGRVYFTIDFRHPDQAVLEARGGRIAAVAAAHARGCTVSVSQLTDVPPTVFAPSIVDLVRDCTAGLGLPYMDMPSGAGHDAMHIATLCPAGMIFVPCERGISHNEAENATPADLAAGCRVLADALTTLANR